jgi:hypothetical protein
MDAQVSLRKVEDQPSLAGVGERETQLFPEERAQLVWLWRVEQPVYPLDQFASLRARWDE